MKLRPLSDPERAAARLRAVDLMYERDTLRSEYSAAVEAALTKYGQGNGVLVSGIYRSHFPESVKEELRGLARRIGELSSESYELWTKRARCTRATWLRFMEEHNL